MNDSALHILIVNDDPATLALMSEHLQARGRVRISTASDGLSALRTVRELHPDAMIADTTLPGLDGFQLCRLLQSAPYTDGTGWTPVILTTTGSYDPLTEEIARSMHAAGCVHPTQDPDRLFDLLVTATSHENLGAQDSAGPPPVGHAELITTSGEPDERLRETLMSRGWDLRTVRDVNAVQRSLQQLDCELILFDHEQLAAEEMQALRALKSEHPDIVFVALMNESSDAAMLSAMQAGADDYLSMPPDPKAADIVCLNALSRHALFRIHRQFEEKIEELRSMSDYLDMVIRYSQEAIFSCDTVGRVRIWNKGAERMYGYTAEEIVGKIVDDYLDPPEFTRKVPDVVRILKQRGWSFVEPEILRRKKDGEIFSVNATYSAIIAPDGECIGFSVIERDVGTHKALEAEKIKSARLRAITQTAVTANDQINTPLGVILGYAQFLQRKMTDIAPEDVAALEIIQQQVLKIKGIMNKLKLMSDPIVKNYSIEGVTMLDLSQSK